MVLSEKAMAPHSSTLAWKIPGTGEPGGLPSMGSHRVGHDRSDLAAAAAAAAAGHGSTGMFTYGSSLNWTLTYVCFCKQRLTTPINKCYHLIQLFFFF